MSISIHGSEPEQHNRLNALIGPYLISGIGYNPTKHLFSRKIGLQINSLVLSAPHNNSSISGERNLVVIMQDFKSDKQTL